MMKLWICLISLIGTTGLVTPAAATEPRWFELDATIGTRFGGRLAVDLEDGNGASVDSAKLSTDSSLAWGIIGSYRVQRNGNIFVSYSRQETTFRLRTSGVSEDGWAVDEVDGDASIEYFQFGGNLQATGSLVVPYLGVSVGLTRIAASKENGGDWARFNVTLDGGLRFDFFPLIDLRVFSRVPFTFPATEVYCFSGYGCALTTNRSPYVQGELHAGLGLKF